MNTANGRVLVAGCGDLGSADNGDGGTSACVWSEHTSATGEASDGCALPSRDTFGCHDARVAAGLDGAGCCFPARSTSPSSATPSRCTA